MKRSAAALFFALVFSVLSGCKTKDAGISFNIALDAGFPSLDPGRSYSYESMQVTSQLTEGLVGFNGKGEVVPVLARDWYQTNDITYIFEVRSNVVFSDGSPMTMKDVLFSLERTRSGDDGNVFAGFFSNVERFNAVGWHLIVTLSRPSAVFKYQMATNAGRIISQSYYLSHRKNFGTARGGILATGPFVLKSWKPGEEIVLEKNERYWDKAARDANQVREVVFKIITDAPTRLAAVQAGCIDFTMFIAADRLGALLNNPDLAVTVTRDLGTGFLGLNTRSPPFSDKNARKAVAHAIDIQRLYSEFNRGRGLPATVLPFGPNLYGKDAAGWNAYAANTPGYDYDLEAARACLAESAYPAGFNCSLVTDPWLYNRARAQFIKESLAPLGINVEIRIVTMDAFYTYLNGEARDSNGERDYDILYGDWTNDYPDMGGILSSLYASSQVQYGYNFAAYSNPRVDALIEDQNAEEDPARRFEIQKQLMDILVDEAPYIPLEYTTNRAVLNTKYQGLDFTGDWQWYLPVQKVTRAGKGRR
ncbi:MAG: ABC transporter substrate-binding protein [Treponema sp.]|jgi:peptide/nickel transport system substrate-binding protein|nr:ABC transporter substrate-binding protein [Treponema sp.]